jgi:3-oxoacyl-[acyl-carrier-protein] synthase III
LASKIISIGQYVPPRLIPNQYFNDLYKQDVDTFLREKRNIHQRYWMNPEQATSDLIVPAAEEAMKNAGLVATDLDLIIVATDTPDFMSPSTAAVVQNRLKATNAGAFDINAACAGFVTALSTAHHFLSGGKLKNILVVGAYGMSKHLDMADYKIASLFADGAGAVIVQRTEDSNDGIQATDLWADGQYFDAMGIYGGGTRSPISDGVLRDKMHLLKFMRKIPPEFNAHHWPRIVKKMCDEVKINPGQVKQYFLTQINIDSIRQTMERLELPVERAHNIMDCYGYTGSACLPMALYDACKKHQLKKGDWICFVGSGGGVSMGGALIRWSFDT